MLEEPQQGAQSTQSQAGRAHAAGTRAPRRRPSGTTLAYLMPSFHWAPVRSLTGTGLGGDLAEQAPGPAFPERGKGASFFLGVQGQQPPYPHLPDSVSCSAQGQCRANPSDLSPHPSTHTHIGFPRPCQPCLCPSGPICQGHSPCSQQCHPDRRQRKCHQRPPGLPRHKCREQRLEEGLRPRTSLSRRCN